MAATTLLNRALIRLSGEDVRGFLQGLITNDVLGELPIWAGLLTPQGKALFDFIVWAHGDDLLIDCERDAASDLAKRLTVYRLRRPITIACDDGLCVNWAPLGDQGSADPRDPRLGQRWIAPAVGDLGADHLGADEAYLSHRLAIGIVEGRAELGSDATLWLEANAREQNGVSFTKGCYIGQENTARMHHREKVKKRIAVVKAQVDPGDAARAFYPDLSLCVMVERNP